MRVFGRLLLVLFASIIASFAAGLVVTLAVVLPELTQLELDPFGGALGVFVGFGAIFVSSFALLPALAVIVVAEALAIRSMLYYAGTGAIVGALLYLGLRGGHALPSQADALVRREVEIMAAAGIAAGLVYWAIAGRTAGIWRRSDQPGPPPAA